MWVRDEARGFEPRRAAYDCDREREAHGVLQPAQRARQLAARRLQLHARDDDALAAALARLDLAHEALAVDREEHEARAVAKALGGVQVAQQDDDAAALERELVRRHAVRVPRVQDVGRPETGGVVDGVVRAEPGDRVARQLG